MSIARLVVTAVRLEGRSKAEVARDYGLSRQWVHELVARFDAEGEAGLVPRSRRPRASPRQTSDALQDEIVELRKALLDAGLDAGAHTIAYHLSKRHDSCPSVATIWRVLTRRGFVAPQPQKRPRSSFVRFEAAMPNERWQADITHWGLSSGTQVEILNVIDDHSRFLVASYALRVFKAADVVGSFHAAAAAHGFPAALLTDNGAVFSGASRGGRVAIELEADRLGVLIRHSSPYHPQTCGKCERLHGTAKSLLEHFYPDPPADIGELQTRLDHVRGHYNHTRRHSSVGRIPPQRAWERAREHGGPAELPRQTDASVHVLTVVSNGTVTLGEHVLSVGRAHIGATVTLLRNGDHVTAYTTRGEVLGQIMINPTGKRYQGSLHAAPAA